MPFTQNTIDFLFENRLHDSKQWFAEHKEDYRRYVTEPMTQLISDVAPAMAKIDPLIMCDPKRISRIYRDARYAKDSVFRDHIWYTFSRVKEQYMSLPAFYFSVGSSGMSYGCGFYCPSTATMQTMRELIVSGSAEFAAALSAYKGQRVFGLYGDKYKRSKFPDMSGELRDWLDRKSIGLSFDTDDPEIMFSEKLSQKVARDFRKIAPVYEFLLKAHIDSEHQE